MATKRTYAENLALAKAKSATSKAEKKAPVANETGTSHAPKRFTIKASRPRPAKAAPK